MQEVTIPMSVKFPYGNFPKEALEDVGKVHSPKSTTYNKQYSYTYSIENEQLSLARLYGEPRGEVALGKIKEFITEHFEQLKELPEGLGQKIRDQVNLLIDKSQTAHMARVIEGFIRNPNPQGGAIPIPPPPIARIDDLA